MSKQLVNLFATLLVVTMATMCIIMTARWNSNTSHIVLPEQRESRHFNLDTNQIYVDDTESKRMFEEVKLFCWILTTMDGLSNKALAINHTWAPRCNEHVYVVSFSSTGSYATSGIPTIPTTRSLKPVDMSKAIDFTDGLGISSKVFVDGDIVYIDSPDGWENLTEKSREIITYIYQTKLDKFDWFLKGDDDTYIIIENLRFLLSQFDKNNPLYLGYHLEPLFFSDPYMSGGAGYVFSQAGFKALTEKGLNVRGACKESGSFEDLEIGTCAAVAGVSIGNSLDRFDRETFHPDQIADFIPGPPMAWLSSYARNQPKGGSECCSQFSISFHRMSPQSILIFDHLLYRTSVHGRHIPHAIPQFHKTGTVPKLPMRMPPLNEGG